MKPKQVVFVAERLDNAHKFKTVLAGFDVGVAAGSSALLPGLLAKNPSCDLVIAEVYGDVAHQGEALVRTCLAHRASALLVILPAGLLGGFCLPSGMRSDFVVADAGPEECAARIRGLLAKDAPDVPPDVVCVDAMTLNLATYQVRIGDEPIDLTYLEYALLAFLVTHSGHAYSRCALLRQVWGFDSFGGSRTVDVHVRRVRAKIGPELAQHLETVRGVGYLWSH